MPSASASLPEGKGNVAAPIGSSDTPDNDPGSRAAPPVGTPAGRLARRDFLYRSGAVVTAGGVAGALGQAKALAGGRAELLADTVPAGARGPAGTRPAAASAAQPIRPPAVPLAVRSPYLSTWLPATTLPGTWQQFWTGHTTAMGGIARIDGVSYLFMGNPGIILDVPNGNHGTPATVQGFERALGQTLLEVTPTRSRFTLEGGGVRLVVEFLSPVEAGDLRRQSIPVSYVLMTASSIDGRGHDVQLYVDISGEWATSDDGQVITWAPSQVPYQGGSLRTWAVQPRGPRVLAESGDMAAWGTVVWATPDRPGLTFQSGQDILVRAQFTGNGSLTGANDTNYRAIGDNWPVFAFCADLGTVTGATTVAASIGHVRTPAVSYLGQDLQPLWTSYFATWQDMLGFFHADLAAARRRASALDARVTAAAIQAGGTNYLGLCDLALRQAYGGTELVAGPGGAPWAFLKEISSDGNVSTVDVLYPASPAWMYLDPAYLGLLLEPLLTYAETGGWPGAFAEHDLGSSYPNAAGHNNGAEEDMPVEESGNMLIMAAAYLKRVPPATAAAFAKAHYTVLKRWADYLVANLPDPGFQNQTDDFAGSIAHSVNLALKGIVAVAAMGQVARVAGNPGDASSYDGLARQFISYWAANAQDPSGAHLDLTYNGAGGGNGTWGTTYNGFADRLLGTNLVPESIRAGQAAWYATLTNEFGLPLQIPHSYAKADWEIFTAAWLSEFPVRQDLIDRAYLFASTSASRVPFTDLYDTISGLQVAFQARPVVGGIFALLALTRDG